MGKVTRSLRLSISDQRISRILNLMVWILIYGVWVTLMVESTQALYEDAMIPRQPEMPGRAAQGMAFAVPLMLYGTLVIGVLGIVAWWWHERRTEVVVLMALTALFVVAMFTEVGSDLVVMPVVEEYRIINER